MHLNLFYCNILVLFIVSCDSCPIFYSNDDNDPGEPLYLTKFIGNGEFERARDLALVNHPNLWIESYAGYFTVNKQYNSNIFFWFFPAMKNPDDAPVLLWLEGGPGVPSFFAIFNKNGPFIMTPNRQILPQKYSWHTNYNLIYFDSPVGTGFSFTDYDIGYAKYDRDVSQNLLIALQQFFLLFPSLQKNDFFVSGESYGGKFVPAVGYAIHQDNKRETTDPKTPKINLKGLAIGNGWSDPIHQFNYADYLWHLGLIDSNGRNLFVESQNKAIECIQNRNFQCAFEIFDQTIFGNLSPYPTLFTNLTGFKNFFNFLETEHDDQSVIGGFVQESSFRRAIHVGGNSFTYSTNVLNHLKADGMESVTDWMTELLSHYSILIYAGQLDICVAYPMIENYLQNLQFNGVEEYKTAPRYIWRVDNEIAGYAKHIGNLTEILVRNAGHMVPRDQPKWAFDMMSRFTSYKSFH